MKIHEYQAKELFKNYSIPVPEGGIAFSPEEAKEVANKIGTLPVVVKAQIHAGGRGQGGGVKLAKSIHQVRDLADEIIGMTLVTHQTGPEGKQVRKVLVEQGLNIEKELYISIIPDRANAKIAIMASETGGMDIEKVASETPEKIIKFNIDPLVGIQPYHCRKTAFGINLPVELMKQFCLMLRNLYRLFVDYDCMLLEINPLVITAEKTMIALDAKVDIDNNALYRHKDILEFRDVGEENPLDVEAARYSLNYIKLDGNVGIMVNGAGLAMATMDTIKLAGAEPANFLDVSGGASVKMVENGLRILFSDKNVKIILINIFGGILRCSIMAKGIVQAAQKIHFDIPVVIRMAGSEVDEGRKILSESGLNLIPAEDMNDAAKKIAGLLND